jgi:galactokinase
MSSVHTYCYAVPGRIELVGKHVDYAGGRSLTCATDCGIRSTVTPIQEAMLYVRNADGGDEVRVALDTDARAKGPSWGTYAAAVARRLARDFPHARRGARVTMQSDLPASAGLSSSTALVVTLAMSLIDANDLKHDERWTAAVPTPIALAEYVAAMETGAPFGAFAGDAGVGVRGGAQDHVAIVCSRAGQIGQYRYLPPRLERYIQWPTDYVMAIGVSGVHAAKTGNARDSYNNLSDAVRDVATRGYPPNPSPELTRRLVQFHEETDVIVPGVGDALVSGDFGRLGALVDRSQSLAEQVLGNQVPETVFLAREARTLGAVAASAFGAGFGGAVWAMVARHEFEDFLARWRAAYEHAFPKHVVRARWLITLQADGAHREPG